MRRKINDYTNNPNSGDHRGFGNPQVRFADDSQMDIIAEKLGILPGEDIAFLQRLRLADGEPLSIESSHLVHRQCPGVLEGDYARNPLREALVDNYDLRLSRKGIRGCAC